MLINRGQAGPEARGAVCALGNFDGVHRGHQSVLEIAATRAKAARRTLGVVTFEPHPRSFFAPNAPPFRLMNAGARAHRLERLGVEVLHEIAFDAALAGLSAEAFARAVLVDALGVAHVVVGADFRFGKGREGDVARLSALGEILGFGVSEAPILSDAQGDISSTAIRAALTDGRPEDATAMLGHRHRIEGRVEKGDQRGRDLGFPTANLSMEGLHLPRFGVYAVTVDIIDGPHQGRFGGAASIGVRPTFGENRPNLEVFLFDFSGDLYGAEISVGLVEFLRPELAYDGVDPLIAQMNADCEAARAILAQDAHAHGH
ncbi:MAG: bifunctional riboflavin kinase/FAD synthetase [Pseudomonadota bacterium]